MLPNLSNQAADCFIHCKKCLTMASKRACLKTRDKAFRNGVIYKISKDKGYPRFGRLLKPVLYDGLLRTVQSS